MKDIDWDALAIIIFVLAIVVLTVIGIAMDGDKPGSIGTAQNGPIEEVCE